MSVRIGIAVLVGLVIGSVPVSAVAGGGGGGVDIERDTIGVVRDGLWFVRSSNDPLCTTAVIGIFGFGASTDTPMSGDPDGDGLDQAAVFRDTDGFGSFFFRDNNDGGAQGATRVNFGAVDDLPVIGNFDTADDGDEVAVYRVTNGIGRFFINTDSGVEQFGFGTTGDVPIAGNWDASVDGSDEVGLFRPSTNQFFLRSANVPAPGATLTVRSLGTTNDLPLVGDWDGDGSTTIAVFRDDVPLNGTTFYNNQTSGSGAEFLLRFGAGTDTPVAGDWDGPTVDENGCP